MHLWKVMKNAKGKKKVMEDSEFLSNFVGP